jgi:hypothetical protein
MPLRPATNMSEDLQRRIEAMRLAAGDARSLEAMSTAPHVVKFYYDQFYDGLFFGGVAPIRIKELVRLRLSLLHGCAK